MDRRADMLSPGPDDPSVLYRQSSHRSSKIWDSGDEVVLYARHSKQMFHHFTRVPIDARVIQYVVRAGLYGFYRIGSIKLYHPLITALVERWRPETHTFHMPCGECTVTLEDISVITGLPADGFAVTGRDEDHSTAEWVTIVERLLGIAPPPSVIHGARMQISWLIRHFTRLPDGADDQVVRQHARATLFLLIGGAMFADKSGNLVKLMYLQTLEHLEHVGHYSWGSAALAWLYREMCRAAQPGAKEISGPLAILQIWAWERFSCMRPLIRQPRPAAAAIAPGPEDAVDGGGDEPAPADGVAAPGPGLAGDADPDIPPLPADPYGYRWRARLTLTASRTLREYRDQLDMMTEAQMTWQPYPPDLPIPARDQAIWRARVPLICYDVVEMYFPDRVMRQFGMLQEEPATCDTSLALHALDRRGRAGTRWDVHHREHIAVWEDRLNMIVTADPFIGRIAPDDPYMRWYRTISRAPIGPLREVPPIGSQPAAATKTILVDTAVRATQIAIDILSCRDWDEVRRLAETMRSIGRRTIAAIDEEYRLAESGQPGTSSSPSHVGPSASTRAGPSTSVGTGPSSSPGFTPSPPAAPTGPPSPILEPHYPLESIDDYTIVMDDVATTLSPVLEPTPPDGIPSASAPPQEDITAPPPPIHYTRKRRRARFSSRIQPPTDLQLAHDPEPHSHPAPPQTQPQVQEGRRNPPRNRRAPTYRTK